MGGIQDVYVYRQIERMIAYALANSLHDLVYPVGIEVVAVHDFETQILVALQVIAVVQRTSDSNVHRRMVEKQSLFTRAPKDSPVGMRCTEICVPCVEMGIEMHQRNGSHALVDGAQQGKGDRVVAAHADNSADVAEEVGGRRLDLLDSLGDVERIAGDVARVGDLLLHEGLGPVSRMKLGPEVT